MRVAALCACLALAAPAWAGDTTREVVPEVNAFFKLSDETRLFLLGDQTRNQTENTTQSEIGAHLDITLMPLLRPQLLEADWHRNRYLWMRVGYVRLDHPSESRGVLELTGRVPLPSDVWLVGRGRADLRDIDGKSSQRYRFRLGIEREFTVGGMVIVPYAQAETFYDTRYDAWSRQLYQFGAEIELTKQWRIEPYYARQNDTHPSDSHVNRVGLILKYYH